MTTLIQLHGFFTFESCHFLSSNCAFAHWNNVKNANLIFYCMVKLLLRKMLFLLHGEIIVGEVAVGEIIDWGNWLFGKLLFGEAVLDKLCLEKLGKLLSGKLAIWEIAVGEAVSGKL